MTKPLFKPRKPRAIYESTKKSLLNHIKNSNSITELTKNDFYCISKLPALPSILNKSHETLSGYSDNVSNYSVTVSEEGIFVWSYQSTDTSPLVIEFPIDNDDIESEDKILPLAILTRPLNNKEPGIVIINGKSGLLKFYKNVQHSPALGLINNKNFEITIPLKIHKGEFITFAENIEPAGIVVVTSWKRVILVSLRDYQNKPRLHCLELLKSSTNILKFFNVGNDSINQDIVSIRPGKLFQNGIKQEIIIQEINGLIHNITVNLASNNGLPNIDESTSFKYAIGPYVESSIDGFNSLSSSNIQYLDIWKLHTTQTENTFLILCLISDHFNKHDQSLVLVTAKVERTGVLVYGSHISNRFNGKLVNKAKLFVPNPETTAFVITDNSIILTDMDYSYFLSKGTILYYKSRWEDIINIKNDIDIIGLGYEDKTVDNNPAVILLTSNFGVLRVERFNNGKIEDYSSNPQTLVKSHIEQAIFYSNSKAAIDFNLYENFNEQIISLAVEDIIFEVMNSTSQYLPNSLPTIKTLLDKKYQVLENLDTFITENYNISESIKLKIIYGLEKVQFSNLFYSFLDKNDAFGKDSKIILSRIITSEFKEFTGSKDIIRKFFNEKIESINYIFTQFVNVAIEQDLNSIYLLDLVTTSLYDGVLNIDIPKLENIRRRKSWIFETDVFFNIEKYFQTRFFTENSFVHPIEVRKNISKLCNVFYYFINQAINYMNLESNNDIKTYSKWYNINKVKWIQILLSNQLIEEAIILVEQYKDFNSLSIILEDEREKIIDTYGLNSIQYDEIIVKYYVYFEKYHYAFAESLFNHYINHDNIQTLLTGFPRYKHLLDQFLISNQDKVSSVAWISYLNDGKYAQSCDALLNSARLFNNESQSNQELKYSLAKLSAIASKNEDNVNLDENLFTIETKLILIRIQKSLYQYVNEIFPNAEGNEDLVFNSFVKNFLNPRIDDSTLHAIFKPTFKDFISNKQLSENELIKYLTFVKPTAKFANGFANAFKIASLFTDESDYKTTTKSIWCRLLSITDDWEDIIKTDKKTDEYVRRKVQNSTILKTIKSFNDDKELLVLEELLTDEEDYFNDENILLSELNKTYFNIARKNIEKYNILDWIKSIRNQDDLYI